MKIQEKSKYLKIIYCRNPKKIKIFFSYNKVAFVKEHKLVSTKYVACLNPRTFSCKMLKSTSNKTEVEKKHMGDFMKGSRLCQGIQG